MKKVIVFLAAFTALCSLCGLAYATQVYSKGLTLDRISNDADIIVYGTCVDAKTIAPDNRSTIMSSQTIYTFKIDSIIKDPSNKYKEGDDFQFTVRNIRGMPAYSKGNEHLLFLTPVALVKFDVVKTPDGTAKIRSSLSSQLLFKDLLARKPALKTVLSDTERETISIASPNTNEVDFGNFLGIVKKLQPTVIKIDSKLKRGN